MNFFSKLLLTFALVAAGSYIAVTKVPNIRNRVMAMMSPQIAQTQLLDQLQTNLHQLSATVPQASAVSVGASKVLSSSTIAHAQKLITQSQDLIKQISDQNQHDSIVQQVVGKIVSTFVAPPVSSTPAPSAVTVATSPLSPAVPCVTK